jgi:hypothetical protein
MNQKIRLLYPCVLNIIFTASERTHDTNHLQVINDKNCQGQKMVSALTPSVFLTKQHVLCSFFKNLVYKPPSPLVKQKAIKYNKKSAAVAQW